MLINSASRVRLCWLALICANSLALIGCGKGSGLVPVTGKITVDGKPAEGAVLLFHPTSSENTSIASAVAKEDGSFAPVTNSEPGIVAGSYKVSITWPDPKVKPSERELMMGTAEPGPDLLKGRYQTKEKSDVTVDVAGDTKELPSIDLKSK